MKNVRTALLAFAAATLVWLVFSWPLPLHMSEAASTGVAKRQANGLEIHAMIPGDHLQFIYYLWLAGDYLTGQTPFFYNLYEFNLGDDLERYRPGSYYFPWCVAFLGLESFGNRAVAWNLLVVLALGLLAWFTLLLTRRYTERPAEAWVGALLVLVFPYQWIQLLGGSPAGYGMVMIPLLFLGLDLAIRDERPLGGVLAGTALLVATFTDTHAFYFGALAAPAWAVVAWSQRRPWPGWTNLRCYLRMARALSPSLLLVGAAIWLTTSGTKNIAQSKAAGGRTVNEVSLFTPKAEGLFAWQHIDISYHVYVGFVITALLLAGWLVALIRARPTRPDEPGRPAWMMTFLVGGSVMVALLALGPFSPWEGRVFTAVRKFVPHYDMIRQTAKIYVILPSLLAVGAVVALRQLRLAWPARGARALAPVIASLLAVEYYLQSMPILNRVETRQGAYAAVADHAAARQQAPRALILPLWPGDSHFTSIYQHYASLYRIRMMNGYRPFVPTPYLEQVWQPFKSVNLGEFTDAQRTNLLGRGVHYLVLHEDLFPEKVSPFPIATTLKRLHQNPYLEFLAQDGPVWSFRILSEPRSTPSTWGSSWNYIFPATHLELERAPLAGAPVVDDPTAGGRRFLRMTDSTSVVASVQVETLDQPGLRWILRLRGQGQFTWDHTVASNRIGSVRTLVNDEAWHWQTFPIPAITGLTQVGFALHSVEGRVEVDTAKLVAGPWPSLAIGESITLPAPGFFHAGNIDPTRDTVEFRAGRDREALMLYGPKLPVMPGRYRIESRFSTPAETQREVAVWIAACPEGAPEIGRIPLLAGETQAGAEMTIPNNQPLLLALLYYARDDLSIGPVTLTRLPDEATP
jgi:hypothetical protein